jgi:hypothetical protein
MSVYLLAQIQIDDADEDNNYVLVKGDPPGERLAKVTKDQKCC